MADGSKAAGERTREFAVFRLSEALQPEPTGYAGMSAVAADGLAQLRDAGLSEGVEARMLFEVPGFSLAYAWFKSNFPVFRHCARATASSCRQARHIASRQVPKVASFWSFARRPAATPTSRPTTRRSGRARSNSWGRAAQTGRANRGPPESRGPDAFVRDAP
jgi:hypothetical protein